MYKIAKIFQAITYWPIFLTLKLLWRYEVTGQENLKGLEDKGIIFASNHASYLDGPISAASMPRDSFYPGKFFPIRFLALREFFNWRNSFPFLINYFVAAYVRVNGSIPINRTGGDLFKALTSAIEALKKGHKIWIYPEGEKTKDGNLQSGKRGVAFLHQQTKAPIVPVRIIGNFKMFSLKNIFNRRKLYVKIGKPIYSFGNASLEEGTKIVMSKIAELLD